jgi:transcriptional regulator with XRE-family HTH domain
MRLGAYLELTGISQVAFAATVGVQQGTVSRYVSGKIPPSAAVMVRIRDASRGAVALDDWAPEKEPRRRAAPAAGALPATKLFG